LTGQTLTFLASDIQLTAATGHPEPWSAAERICVVPHTYNSFGDRSFSAAGPRVEYSASIYAKGMYYGHSMQALKGRV